jgi:hypothetical protein
MFGLVKMHMYLILGLEAGSRRNWIGYAGPTATRHLRLYEEFGLDVVAAKFLKLTSGNVETCVNLERGVWIGGSLVKWEFALLCGTAWLL